ncbi:MAG: class I SAM-dependent methyltransferase [Myxococcota bacterium]
MPKTKVDLGPVQETLLIPLLGRAQETEAGGRLLSDPKAVEIVQQLDYDFAKWGTAARGACIRTRWFDSLVTSFLAAHPTGTVVEIGAGLNTRYERLDNGRARWFEVDLPDSMALRRRFFDDDARRTMYAASALDIEWLDEVAKLPGPYCFVSEAVLIYLDAAEAELVVKRLAERFPGAQLLMDITPARAIALQPKSALMRVMDRSSWFRWACDDVGALARLGAHVERQASVFDVPPDIRPDLSWGMRFALTVMPRWLFDKMSGGYRICRFRLEAAT